VNKTEWVTPDKPPKELRDKMTVKVLIGAGQDIVECWAEEYYTSHRGGGVRFTNVLVITTAKSGPGRITHLYWLITTKPFIITPLKEEAKHE